MTSRQRKFAEYYAESGNATQSAIKAGYSEKYANTNASKLLNVEEVRAYIKELTEKEQQGRIMSALERQALLSDIIRDDNAYIGARLRAVEILNKMTGTYLPDNDNEDIYNKLQEVLDTIFDDNKPQT